MHSRVITEIMIGNNTNEIINELFSSLLTRYQISLETSMKGSLFVLIILMECVKNVIE